MRHSNPKSKTSQRPLMVYQTAGIRLLGYISNAATHPLYYPKLLSYIQQSAPNQNPQWCVYGH